MKLKNLHQERTRHGKIVYYFRQARKKRIRLPNELGSAEFLRAYAFATELAAGEAEDTIARRAILRIREFASEKREKMIRDKMARVIKGAEQRAKERGFGFDINLDWIMAQALRQEFRCSMTRIPFYFDSDTDSKTNPYAPSIDRIDSKIGYTRDNVRIVIYAVNIMLCDWGDDVFEHVIESYKANRKSTNPPARCGEIKSLGRELQREIIQ